MGVLKRFALGLRLRDLHYGSEREGGYNCVPNIIKHGLPMPFAMFLVFLSWFGMSTPAGQRTVMAGVIWMCLNSSFVCSFVEGWLGCQLQASFGI